MVDPIRELSMHECSIPAFVLHSWMAPTLFVNYPCMSALFVHSCHIRGWPTLFVHSCPIRAFGSNSWMVDPIRELSMHECSIREFVSHSWMATLSFRPVFYRLSV